MKRTIYSLLSVEETDIATILHTVARLIVAHSPLLIHRLSPFSSLSFPLTFSLLFPLTSPPSFLFSFLYTLALPSSACPLQGLEEGHRLSADGRLKEAARGRGASQRGHQRATHGRSVHSEESGVY